VEHGLSIRDIARRHGRFPRRSAATAERRSCAVSYDLQRQEAAFHLSFCRPPRGDAAGRASVCGEDDDALPRFMAALEVVLCFGHLVESGVGAGDNDVEGASFDRAKILCQRTCGKVVGTARVAGEADTGGNGERREVGDGPFSAEGANEADCAARADEGERVWKRGCAD